MKQSKGSGRFVGNVSLNFSLLLNQSYAIRITPLVLTSGDAFHFSFRKFSVTNGRAFSVVSKNEKHLAMYTENFKILSENFRSI